MKRTQDGQITCMNCAFTIDILKDAMFLLTVVLIYQFHIEQRCLISICASTG